MAFRELARKKQRLSDEECAEILTRELRGVLSVQGDDGYPYGVPINHYYCPEDGKLYFHSGPRGHKIDAIKRCDKACFTVYDQGKPIVEGGWALNIRSVVVFGRIEIVEDRETIYRMARELTLKFTDDEAYIAHELDHSGPNTFMFALAPEFMTGKSVKEE
jgi:nitroimidazol reductase NimA-like FMN-containing flavoprotein (pyridoxamine 5'-phosphate oxidase superfamily)